MGDDLVSLRVIDVLILRRTQTLVFQIPGLLSSSSATKQEAATDRMQVMVQACSWRGTMVFKC